MGRFHFHTHDELRHGAPVHLAYLRRDAGRLAANPHRNMRLAASPTWLTVRYRKLSEEFPRACHGFQYSDPCVSGFDEDCLPVRDVRYVDEMRDVATIRHQGWFADSDGTGDRGVIRGIVCRISHGRFLAGYHWSDNDEYCIVAKCYSDERTALFAADRLAERLAEDYREDDYQFRAMTDAEGHAESMEWDARMAYEARNVSAPHREHARERIGELRAARADVEKARRAYEGV